MRDSIKALRGEGRVKGFWDKKKAAEDVDQTDNVTNVLDVGLFLSCYTCDHP